MILRDLMVGSANDGRRRGLLAGAITVVTIVDSPCAGRSVRWLQT